MNHSLWTTILIGFALFSAQTQPRQNSASASKTSGEAVLTKLATPSYPPIARQLNAAGEVEIVVHVAEDGHVESAEAVRGYRLLVPAALESAEHSLFVCHGCGDSGATLELFYSFTLTSETHCSPSPTPLIDQSVNHITLTAERFSICDGEAIFTKKARSAKCLYLWKCVTKQH